MEGPEQSAASSSRSAFRTLDVTAIGQHYNTADEDLVGNVQGKGVGGVDWAVYALGEVKLPVPGFGLCATGVVIGGQMRHRCNA